MAKSKTEQIDEAVIRLVKLLAEEHGTFIDRVSVYPAHSGEYPYQIETREEQLPLAGLAVDPDPQATFPADQTPTSRNESDSEGSRG